ncbi:metallophosphoesterase [Shinella curvata]|uniref:Metallophosphoesterase n=1 Tax=Shinella curvata TaxID=1817964 RepID=A0ABT8XB75_9HYPH|nr:metallophosphoesterase [Shinella curvata]MCJ8054674.1 metallophosphoesterase [Shinella curvata]MDO6120931.1 metallophosphoesterase [Shinella curvata]
MRALETALYGNKQPEVSRGEWINMKGEHVFAIGDIHGRADLLGALLATIEVRAGEMNVDFSIVFLGDIIDHGPRSRDAVEMVEETLARTPSSRLILGNHDWFPLRILHELTGDQQNLALDFWIRQIGGRATLLSYDFDPDTFSVRDLERHFPRNHLEIFHSAARYVELPKHILVHAGLAPNVSLADQTRRNLMWIREPFLSTPYDFGKVVVHGHSVTPSLGCEIARHRIGIDTGAYKTDRLSAIHIKPDGHVEFLQTNSMLTGIVEDVDPVYV